MKNNVFGMLFTLLIMALSASSCSDWIEVEDLNPEQKNISDQNPELYAKYLQNLREYKKSAHKLVYVWFDNSQKAPYSRAHHIADLPDSIDVVGMIHPDNLVEWELKEMDKIRNDKATKVIYTIDFEAFKNAYIVKLNLATDEEPVTKDFIGFLTDSLEYALSLSTKYRYDGICIGYNGKSKTHMRPDELKKYKENETLFVNIILDWHKRNSQKTLVYEGQPQNLIKPALLDECLSILISGKQSPNENDLTYRLLVAAKEDIPHNRFGMIVTAIDLNDAKKAVGYFSGGKVAIAGLADWATIARDGIEIAAVGVYNVSTDYYTPGKDYYYTRQLISTVNSPVK